MVPILVIVLRELRERRVLVSTLEFVVSVFIKNDGISALVLFIYLSLGILNGLLPTLSFEFVANKLLLVLIIEELLVMIKIIVVGCLWILSLYKILLLAMKTFKRLILNPNELILLELVPRIALFRVVNTIKHLCILLLITRTLTQLD